MPQSRAGMNRLALSMFVLSFTAPVQAGERAGWVDPPAKTEQPASDAAAPSPVKPATSKPERITEAPRPVERRTVRRQAKAPAPTPATGPAHLRAARNDADGSTAPASSIASAGQRTVAAYLAAVSSNGTIVSSTSRFYADRVRYHGRLMTRTALAAEKARFARRWPDRRYEPRGTAHTACDPARVSCTVTTVFVFRAADPMRGIQSAGVGELVLTVDFAGERPVILSESSRVLRRGASALGPINRRDGDA